MTTETKIKELIETGALFVINHSGGKDSQAMYIKLSQMVPEAQILIIHAELPGVDWPGIVEHITGTTNSPLTVTKAGKTFFDMVKHRGMWPSPKYRQCTSDLKRAPIEKAIRHHMKAHGLTTVVSCMGIRAEESSSRSKATVFKYSDKNSKAGRQWYEWLPIHALTEVEVFSIIRDAGQLPHEAYSLGMGRLSCCFCIMSSKKDLQTAARLQPELFEKYVATEKEIDHTFIMPKKDNRVFLDQIVS